MKVGEAGEAFFVFETDHEVPEEFQTSPILQALAENRSDVEVRAPNIWLKLYYGCHIDETLVLKEPPFLDISEQKDEKGTC